uniref:Serpentine receptor class gamma n=1 Tax=Caenorhabditis tropicalis TaxID=1561998 RepID=A0A1I7T4R7_9PELO
MSCQQDVSLLENPTVLRNTCFFLTILEVFITSYTLYLLIFHSPTQMKEMKWYLLNMACWTRSMDLMYSLFVIPYFFIPTLVVMPVGLFSLIGVPTEIQLVTLVLIISVLVNLSTILITFHGTITSISTIAINRPFRNRVKKWIYPKRFKNRRSSTKLNVLTVSSSWL